MPEFNLKDRLRQDPEFRRQRREWNPQRREREQRREDNRFKGKSVQGVWNIRRNVGSKVVRIFTTLSKNFLS